MAARKIRMGIVGMTNDHVWSMGQSLAALPTVEMVAGAEPHAELREQVRARFGLQTVYDDYRAMFARERLDAILVCSDNASKVTIIEEAAKHGLHVYAGKPMAANLAQADRICAAAERNGIKVMIAYHFYFGSTYVKTGELLRAGRIGNMPFLQSYHGREGTILTGFDAVRIYARQGCPPICRAGWNCPPGLRCAVRTRPRISSTVSSRTSPSMNPSACEGRGRSRR